MPKAKFVDVAMHFFTNIFIMRFQSIDIRKSNRSQQLPDSLLMAIINPFCLLKAAIIEISSSQNQINLQEIGAKSEFNRHISQQIKFSNINQVSYLSSSLIPELINAIQYIRMLYQDLLYFGGYVLFIFLAFRLIFLSSRADPPKQNKLPSPKNTKDVKSPKNTKEVKTPTKNKQIKFQIQSSPVEREEMKREEIPEEKAETEFTKFNLNPIEEDRIAEDQESKNYKLVEDAMESQSQSQQLTLNNQSRILILDTESPQKKLKQQLRREKEINRLRAVKDHYKTIIAGLQSKLQNHCRQHNESLESMNPYQSIIFEQQDSCSNISQQQGPFQLNVSQINNLKDQLYMHQQILTNLLDQQNQLKDKVRMLESQNKKLLESSAKPQQKEQNKGDSQILLSMLQNLTSNQPKMEQSPAHEFRLEQNEETNIANIKGLYESRLIEPERIMERSALQQQSPPPFMGKSTISMMSILEGVLNLGLLGQCRSLNEINKKYVMQEIKKATKKRATDTEIVYNSEQAQKNDIVSEIKQESSVLFLIKLSNSKKIAIFVQYPIVEDTISSENPDDKNFIVLMDLNKRKSTSANETVRYSQNALIFGNEQIIINRSKPLSLASKGTGNLITTAHPIQQLIDHSDKSIGISLLQIYSLIFQE